MRSLVVAMLATYLGGCSGVGIPFGEVAVNDKLTTGSITKTDSPPTSKVAQSDWEAIRESIAQAAAKDDHSQPLAWRNPETGSTGTLMVLNTVPPTNDPSCRNFQTTVNDLRGIRHYRGEACRMIEGRWQLLGVLADDSKLL